MRKDIEKLYYNLEKLHDDYKDLDDTKESSNKLTAHLKEQAGRFFTSKSILELDNYIRDLCSANEKQGFIYGFEYAVRLLTLSERNMEE